MTMFDPKPITKDAPLSDTVNLGDNTIHLERKEPFGFIHLRLATGNLPEKYQGCYTSFDLARLDANKYKQELERAKTIRKIKSG